ncbi:hypothetical protein GCM10010344_22220 [Streptomyces bluensis]|nr:hypothetical protein GCM10010344_22220 [Streptomyces bluensis]
MAAAQEARDELLLGLGDAIGTDDDWLDWLNLPVDVDIPNDGPSAAAQALAADNDATALGGAQREVVDGYLGFRVAVRTNYTVGNSIIPGTENMQAEAEATAVIKPRCEFDVDADPTKPVDLVCDGEPVSVDPEDFDPDDLPDASVMFSVRLAE